MIGKQNNNNNNKKDCCLNLSLYFVCRSVRLLVTLNLFSFFVKLNYLNEDLLFKNKNKKFFISRKNIFCLNFHC